MKKYLLPILLLMFLPACNNQSTTIPATGVAASANTSFDSSGRDDVLSGGVKLIPITTPIGKFNV